MERYTNWNDSHHWRITSSQKFISFEELLGVIVRFRSWFLNKSSVRDQMIEELNSIPRWTVDSVRRFPAPGRFVDVGASAMGERISKIYLSLDITKDFAYQDAVKFCELTKEIFALNRRSVPVDQLAAMGIYTRRSFEDIYGLNWSIENTSTEKLGYILNEMKINVDQETNS